MRTSLTRLGLLAAALISAAGAGCAPDLPAPQLHKVNPGDGANDEERAVTILGANFFPRVRVTGEEDLDVDSQFELWLTAAALDGEAPGETEAELEVFGLKEEDTALLEDYEEYGALEALIPAGLATGTYDLHLRTPSGQVAALADAYLVTDSKARQLYLDFDDRNDDEVGQNIRGRILLLDSLDNTEEPVQESIAVRLIATDESENPDFEENFRFVEGLLEEQRTLALDEGVGIEGDLAANGTGKFNFTSDIPTPDGVRLEVTAVDAPLVKPHEVLAYFQTGTTDGVEIRLPSGHDGPEGFVTTAGEEFVVELVLVDDKGNPTVGESKELLLQESCASTYLPSSAVTVTVNDRATFAFTAHAATGTEDCAANTLIASLNNIPIGQSEAFTVEPGPAYALEAVAVAVDNEVQAGQLLPILIWAEDEYGNELPDYDADLTFSRGLTPVEEGDSACESTPDGARACEVTLREAGEGVVLTVTADQPGGDIVTETTAFDVLPAEAAKVNLRADPVVTTADESRLLTLQVTDIYDNPIGIPEGGGDAPLFTLQGEAADCQWAGAGALERSELYLCAVWLAGPGVTLEVQVLDVAGASAPFEVLNGALASLSIAAPAGATAGEAAAVALAGFDQWGNPFAEPGAGSQDVELYDDNGDIAELVTLEADGTASLAGLVFTTAGENQLHGWQDGLNLGSSPVFEVQPGDMAGFSVAADQTFAWLGEPLTLTVAAVDGWGNPVPGYAGAATLRSAGDLGEPVAVAGWADGVATAAFTWDAAALGDWLIAEDGGWSGVSGVIDALDAGCGDGPVAEVTVDGGSWAVLCRAGGETDPAALDASGSSAGASPLLAWHWQTDGAGWQRTLAPALAPTWTEEGAWAVSLVAADAAGCAAEASARVYVADDDQEPAGPVAVLPQEGTIWANTAGSSGETVVDIAATTCSGAPAAGGSLLVRADLGAVSAASTAVDRTGAGLLLTLDAAGEATILWRAGDQLYDGPAQLLVARADGAADGAADVLVGGDAAPPQVWSADPAGTTDELFDQLVLVFSEDIDPDTVSSGSVAILASDGTPQPVLAYEVDGATLTVTLADLLDGAADAWTLRIDPALADLAGNALDGDFRAVPAPFLLEVGDVNDEAPDVTACAATPAVFIPDGDDGLGVEADASNLAFLANGGAAWWQLQVVDEGGEVVYASHRAASGASAGSLTWDGRRRDGRIAEPGAYTAWITARDASWNSGDACVMTLGVQQHVP